MPSNIENGSAQSQAGKIYDPKHTTTPDNSPGLENAMEKGTSTGTNARPLNDTIAQAAPGLPDDSAKPIEITPEEEKAMTHNLIKNGRAK